ncbi:glycine cleavage system H protein [Candidatus Termititenax persephonae]|uniref:Glycine cleavage system H protein n=1 Tax=Candidatus Termititenax persephonae TaxID=2218525 RepID=A0A388TEB3_9BACT|nr:glycine cleavage system H protein [Candidatus Termititenax persephonae]
MSKIPAELRYTAEHEWVRIEGQTAVVGITEHAQAELGDIVFVELPAVGVKVAQNGDFGVVESVKTVSNLYSPLSGTVSAINPQLAEHADLVNKDPYGEGWLIKLKDFAEAELSVLLDAAQYREKIGE